MFCSAKFVDSENTVQPRCISQARIVHRIVNDIQRFYGNNYKCVFFECYNFIQFEQARGVNLFTKVYVVLVCSKPWHMV